MDTLQSLTARADALKASGRVEEAIETYARAVGAAPRSGVAEHNLAAALGDAGRYDEAEAHVRSAFAKGLDAPETWLVLARALQGALRLGEAEQAFREALRRRPAMAEAHRELAQLIWMQSEDIALATAELDRAIAAAPADPVLRLVKGKALEYAGDFAGAYKVISDAAAARPDAVLLASSADAALRIGDLDRALAHAQTAWRLAPGDRLVQTTLAQVGLACGRADQSLLLLEPLHRAAPNDQHIIALLATAWRLTGDARYASLYDYDSLVGVWSLDTPPGWPDLQSYIADLARALKSEHAFRTHPFAQSVRHGSQMPDILRARDPAIAAFPEAVSGPIGRHLTRLGHGTDPVRSRNTGGWRFQGVWSVKLRPNGYHADHNHPQGWLSSACYVELPPRLDAPGREGWIKFGEPGVPTRPPLAPEHFVRPEPGMLVLFPSYMWHGTIPFGGEEPRLTIAFDLVPAPADQSG